MIAANSQRVTLLRNHFAMLTFSVAIASSAAVWAQSGQKPVTLAKNGVAQLPIVAGSVKEPMEELRHYLNELTDCKFEVERSDSAKQASTWDSLRTFPR